MTCQDGGESLENNSSLTEIDVAVLDSIMKRAKDNACTDDEIKHIEGFELSWRFFKNATFAGEFNWFNFRNDPIEESEKLFNDMKAYGVMYLAEAWGVYFGDNEPNYAVMPTFWFHTEENLPQFVRFTSKVYPVINDILRVLFAIPNFLIEIF